MVHARPGGRRWPRSARPADARRDADPDARPGPDRGAGRPATVGSAVEPRPRGFSAPAGPRRAPKPSRRRASVPDPRLGPTRPTVRPQPDVRLLSPPPVVQPIPRGGEVVVRRGDSLWSIAARHLGPDASDAEIAAAWPAWHEANREVIGDDPDLLRPARRSASPEGR